MWKNSKIAPNLRNRPSWVGTDGAEKSVIVTKYQGPTTNALKAVVKIPWGRGPNTVNYQNADMHWRSNGSASGKISLGDYLPDPRPHRVGRGEQAVALRPVSPHEHLAELLVLVVLEVGGVAAGICPICLILGLQPTFALCLVFLQ